MSAISKNARGKSRPPLSEHSDVAQNTHYTPSAGSKRLFSNRESRQSISPQDYGENHNIELPTEEIHSEKRRRASDWPLSNTTPSHAPPPKSTPQRNRHASPTSSHRPSSSQVRPSKFVEGSMNDRVSQKPPTPYLGDEQLREQFLREENARGRKLAQPRKFMHHSNTSAVGSSANRSENSRSRHSSIFRFGKSLAASFNPTNWKIWSKQEHVEEETEQHRTLRERQEKAEKIYKELKQTGHFRDSNFPSTFSQLNDKHFTPTKHDSGVSFPPNSATSRGEKRMGRIFLEPPLLDSRGGSPASNLAESVGRSGASAQKGSFRFRRPSFSNMKKDQGSDSGSIAPEFDDHHMARRVPSRKDMQKQQKLVKRVSDLEGKLEAARRQLCEALGEPVPTKQHQPRTGRPRFVPGALSSLPSERLLSGYVGSEDDDDLSGQESFSQIGRAVTTDQGKDNDVAMFGTRESHELEEDTPAPSPIRVNKPLPKAPQSSQDETMEGVENDEIIEVQHPTKTNPPESEGLDSDPESSSESSSSASSYQAEASPEKETEVEFSDADSLASDSMANASESELMREPTKKSIPAPNRQKTTAARTKKRKSTFERERDLSGTYKPPPKSESSIYSPVKKMKSTPKKSSTNNAPRPRKLQKTVTVQENNGVKSPVKDTDGPSTPVGGKTAPKYRVTPKPIKTGSQVSRSASKLSKPKPVSMGMDIGMATQSMSPPPTSSFTGLDYRKPSSQGKMNSPTKAMGEMSNGTEPMYSAIPSMEGDVPPMPKLPKKVRLPSGEVVSTQTSGSSQVPLSRIPASPSKALGSSQGAGKLTKVKPVDGQGEKGGMKRDESFQWSDDVF